MGATITQAVKAVFRVNRQMGSRGTKLKGDDEVELHCGYVRGVVRCEVDLMGLNGRTALRN